ncbi:MAG TPA: hypothetical protein VD859_10130, partial [Nocardioides sp.]|nr:hypothetical protein [Nocardioides sp.]
MTNSSLSPGRRAAALGAVVVLLAGLLAGLVPGATPARAAGKPDLVVKSGSVKQNDDVVTARFRAASRRADAPPSRIAFALWNEESGWQELSVAKIRRIKAGTGRDVVLRGDTTGAPVGSYQAQACVDYRQQVDERNEDN